METNTMCSNLTEEYSTPGNRYTTTHEYKSKYCAYFQRRFCTLKTALLIEHQCQCTIYMKRIKATNKC